MDRNISPRTEIIDSRDIRNTFALDRHFKKMHEKQPLLDNQWPPVFSAHSHCNGFNTPSWYSDPSFMGKLKPMTEQTFKSDDFESDTASSVGSGGSNDSGGSGRAMRARMTRAPRIHHIPILVEARDDISNSSGYASDTVTESPAQDMKGNTRHHEPEPRKIYNPVTTTQTSSGNKSSQMPCTRSNSNQEFGHPPTRPARQTKAASDPPASPPIMQQGSFVTKVTIKPAEAEQIRHSTSPPVQQGGFITKASSKDILPEEKKPKPSKISPNDQIVNVLEELRDLEVDVGNFNGQTKNKKYRYLDEMLTRCMLKLDDVNTEGDDAVRVYRREAVRQIQACITALEKKVSPVPQERETSPIQQANPPGNHSNGYPSSDDKFNSGSQDDNGGQDTSL